MLARHGIPIALLACTSVNADADSLEAFRFDQAKAATGSVYFYVKSNIDGSHASNVALYYPDVDSIESLKWNDAHAGATLVKATLNWKTFSVARFEVYAIDRNGERRRRALMTDDLDSRRVLVGTGEQRVPTEVGHYPWHSYDFDYASLVRTLPHLVDPEGSVEVGRIDLVREPQPGFRDLGRVKLEFVTEEERGGTLCRRYRVDGEGLENRGGDLWIDKARGHLVDYEIQLPDEPGYTSGKLELVRVQEMPRSEWEAFTRRQGR